MDGFFATRSSSSAWGLPHGSLLWHEALQRATAVAKLCFGLAREGWNPDRILAHTGWGETLGLHEVWPEVPQILWPELWMRPEHGGHGIDPLKPEVGIDQYLDHIGRNALTSCALDHAAAWVLPTLHQANSFPKEFQGYRLRVIHEAFLTLLIPPSAMR